MTGKLTERQKGPVEILCGEVGIDFDPRLERRDVLVAFVAAIVDQVQEMRQHRDAMADFTGKRPTDESAIVLDKVAALLGDRSDGIIAHAATVHDYIHTVTPDDAHPCDHLIDMLSSCVSAVRFGLEVPCRSRHAAAAADHVWKHVYGISRFDKHTGEWEKQWARKMFMLGVISLIPAPQSQ